MRNKSSRKGMRYRLWEWGDYELKERVIRGHRVQEQKNHLSVDILIFLISLHSEGEISDTPESYKGKSWSEQEVFRA